MLSERYELSQDVEINDGVSRVLSVTPSVTLDSVKPNMDYATVSGNVVVDMCYLTNEELPKVRSYTTTLDFSMEVALANLNSDSYIQSDVAINTTDIKVTSNIENDKAVINLVLPVLYRGYAYNKNNLDIVSDIYSTTNELNVSSASVMSIEPSDVLTSMEKISGNVQIEDSFVDEILGNCCNYVTITNTYMEEDGVVVEGVANSTVLYYNKEDNQKNSVMVEMPFSVRVKGDNYNDNYFALVNCVLSDVTTKCKRGQEIEVNAKLYFYVDVYTNEVNAVINEVSEGDAREDNPCALRIYVVKDNESLWDVAKELGTSEDELIMQNPNLELPLKAGDRVFMYYQRVMEF